jgi:hypothetical protein
VSAPHKPRGKAQAPANDNGPRKPLRAELFVPPDLPVQLVEVEVIAELLESLPWPANDNGE